MPMSNGFTYYKSCLLIASHFILSLLILHEFKRRRKNRNLAMSENGNKSGLLDKAGIICGMLGPSRIDLISLSSMICGELALIFSLVSSIGGSDNDSFLCATGYQLCLIFFYLNYILMLLFEVAILRECFNQIQLMEIRKFRYQRHIYKVLNILLTVLAVSSIICVASINSFSSPLSDIGCQWKLERDVNGGGIGKNQLAAKSLIMVIWSWWNSLCLFCIIWLILGMYGYKCFQFKSQYKLSIMYNDNINLSLPQYNSESAKDGDTQKNDKNVNDKNDIEHIKSMINVDITIDNIHEYKKIVNKTYYLLQKILLLMICTEFTGFIVIVSLLLTWISSISPYFIYFVFTMIMIQLIVNSVAVTLMMDDNNHLFEQFAHSAIIKYPFQFIFAHLYEIIREKNAKQAAFAMVALREETVTEDLQ